MLTTKYFHFYFYFFIFTLCELWKGYWMWIRSYILVCLINFQAQHINEKEKQSEINEKGKGDLGLIIIFNKLQTITYSGHALKIYVEGPQIKALQNGAFKHLKWSGVGE